jgi:ABC-2 type transport system permease protein
MKPVTSVAANAVVLSRLPSLGALAALFVLTLRQHLRGRRLLVLSLLFLIPSVLVTLVNLLSPHRPPTGEIQFVFIFNFLPHALAPLAALLYATGIIQDEVEEQTLTYLLLRPLPRWAIYIVKLLATLLVVSVLTTVFTFITYSAIALTTSEPITSQLIAQASKTSLALTLAQAGYCGLFGLLGLLMRRSLFVGIAYIFFFEGILASMDIVARKLTIMYHFRVLILRWLEPANGARDWSINLTTAPDARSCILTLLSVGIALTVVAALFFAGREFRMKTPEGN